MIRCADTQNPAVRPGSVGTHAIEAACKPYRRLPRAGTMRARLLCAFESGRSLTSREAWLEFGAARLAADVHELKRLGWPIRSDVISVLCRDGRTTQVSRYRLAERSGE